MIRNLKLHKTSIVLFCCSSYSFLNNLQIIVPNVSKSTQPTQGTFRRDALQYLNNLILNSSESLCKNMSQPVCLLKRFSQCSFNSSITYFQMIRAKCLFMEDVIHAYAIFSDSVNLLIYL